MPSSSWCTPPAAAPAPQRTLTISWTVARSQSHRTTTTDGSPEGRCQAACTPGMGERLDRDSRTACRPLPQGSLRAGPMSVHPSKLRKKKKSTMSRTLQSRPVPAPTAPCASSPANAKSSPIFKSSSFPSRSCVCHPPSLAVNNDRCLVDRPKRLVGEVAAVLSEVKVRCCSHVRNAELKKTRARPSVQVVQACLR